MQRPAFQRLACSPGSNGDHLSRLADVRERLRLAERPLTEINEERVALAGDLVDERDVANALADFDGVWAGLAPPEQARVLGLLVERIDYDGREGHLAITFRPTGIKTLAAEMAAFSSRAGFRHAAAAHGLGHSVWCRPPQPGWTDESGSASPAVPGS